MNIKKLFNRVQSNKWATASYLFGVVVGIVAGVAFYISPIIIIPWVLASLFGGF